MKEKTLYLSDLDGTLLQNDATLSAFALAQLNRLIDKGLLFSISTARSTDTVCRILKDLRLRLPVSLFNGVLYYDWPTQTFVKALTFSFPAAAKVTRIMADHGIHNTMYCCDGQKLLAYYERLDTPFQEKFVAQRQNTPYKLWQQVPSLEETAKTQQPVFFSLSGEKDRLDPVWKALLESEELSVSYYQDTYDPVWFLEIQPKGVDKALSVRMLRKLCGARRIIAFGDNHNDLAMAGESDYFCAVENAAAKVKEKAQTIIPANTADGVIGYLLDLEKKGML